MPGAHLKIRFLSIMRGYAMRQYLFPILIVFLINMLASGCTYMKIQQPLDTDYNMTELGTKIGRASQYAVFFLVAWGDAGTKAAADNGDIKIIRHADREIFSILFGLYTRVTTVVYGD